MTLLRFGRLAACCLLVALGSVWYVRYCPAMAWNGWELTTLAEGVDRVSGLALAGDGSLYVTQEYQAPGGMVLRLSADHVRRVVLSGLDKPDGIFFDDGDLYVSQEGGIYPVRKVSPSGDQQSIGVEAANLEQIWLVRDSDDLLLYGIEDRPLGNIVRYDFASGKSEVLARGIVEGEGVSVCPDGAIYYAEKEAGEINRLTADGGKELLAGGLNKPGFVSCEAEGVWVSEDANLGAKVYYIHRNPPYLKELVASHLRSAQYIVRSSPTSVLLAEQDRGRVLLLSR